MFCKSAIEIHRSRKKSQIYLENSSHTSHCFFHSSPRIHCSYSIKIDLRKLNKNIKFKSSKFYYPVIRLFKTGIPVLQHFPKGNLFFRFFVVAVEDADETAMEIVDSPKHSLS